MNAKCIFVFNRKRKNGWFFENRCDQLIKEIKRIGDYEEFYSCDQEKCFKYFENEAKYKGHIDHQHS